MSRTRYTPADHLRADAGDWKAWAFLCDRAARGCAHEGESRWAAQLFDDAKRFRELAEDEEHVADRRRVSL